MHNNNTIQADICTEKRKEPPSPLKEPYKKKPKVEDKDPVLIEPDGETSSVEIGTEIQHIMTLYPINCVISL